MLPGTKSPGGPQSKGHLVLAWWNTFPTEIRPLWNLLQLHRACKTDLFHLTSDGKVASVRFPPSLPCHHPLFISACGWCEFHLSTNLICRFYTYLKVHFKEVLPISCYSPTFIVGITFNLSKHKLMAVGQQQKP